MGKEIPDGTDLIVLMIVASVFGIVGYGIGTRHANGDVRVPSDTQTLADTLDTGIAYERNSSTKVADDRFVVLVSKIGGTNEHIVPELAIPLKQGDVPPKYFVIGEGGQMYEIIPPKPNG